MTLNLRNTYFTELPSLFYSAASPDYVKEPEFIIFNEKLCNQLVPENSGCDLKNFLSDYLSKNHGALDLKYLTPIAQAYAGHQFGYFTKLGDGRAQLVCELGLEDGRLFDIHLKGSGKTDYSRRGDGKACIGPMIREYIISEAMHSLGIPTTRSLAVIGTGEDVYRMRLEKGAVLARVASSHIRVGTFEYAAAFGSLRDIKALADYAIDRHYSSLALSQNKYLSLLTNVIQRQAKLMADWMGVGFVHGVMNTDNMAISGETIDYGPCAFLDIYNSNKVFSSIDTAGRYSYGNQPIIAHWNLRVFANALLPIISDNKEESIQLTQHELDKFSNFYENAFIEKMRKKLGIQEARAFSFEDDQILIYSLLDMMERNKADFTNTFAGITMGFSKDLPCKESIFYQDMFKSEEFCQWESQWKKRGICQVTMMKNNPTVIPRNMIVEMAIKEAERENYDPFYKLVQILSQPYSYDNLPESLYITATGEDQNYITYCGT